MRWRVHIALFTHHEKIENLYIREIKSDAVVTKFGYPCDVRGYGFDSIMRIGFYGPTSRAVPFANIEDFEDYGE